MADSSYIKGGVVGGSLLIAGTTIGGGMLALPVLTALGGFYPSLVIFLVCWLFMASTGLLVLECTLWMSGDTNLVSMAEKTLGPVGKIVAWALYLFLFYTLTIAYVSAGGGLIRGLFQNALPDWIAMFLFSGFFGVFVYLGAHYVDRINSLMMIGLGAAYIGFIYLGIPHVQPEYLEKSDWQMSLLALPVAFGAFAYQGTVPTLVRYLDRDPDKLRLSILIGSFIPFVAYGIWQWLIHSIVPPENLIAAVGLKYDAVRVLRSVVDNPMLSIVSQAFLFFAIVTSFLGVTIGLRDFLADGLQIKKDVQGRLFLCAVIFIPPVLIAMGYPDLFLTAFGVAGGFGTALLLGLLPVCMVWVGRYRLGMQGVIMLPGGRPLLVVLVLFIVIEVGCEIAHLLS